MLNCVCQSTAHTVCLLGFLGVLAPLCTNSSLPQSLKKIGLQDRAPVLRLTGCPAHAPPLPEASQGLSVHHEFPWVDESFPLGFFATPLLVCFSCAGVGCFPLGFGDF